MSKRGQFYLVAAIIIIVIIFGMYAVQNYAKTNEESTVVYDLKKEFGLESGKVEDFTLYNSKNNSEYISSWIETYVENKGKNLDNFIVVYGDKTSLNLLKYTKSSAGKISFANSLWDISTQKVEKQLIEDNYRIEIGNSTYYTFKLEPGKNFMFVIKDGEFVASQ